LGWKKSDQFLTSNSPNGMPILIQYHTNIVSSKRRYTQSKNSLQLSKPLQFDCQSTIFINLILDQASFICLTASCKEEENII